MLTDCYPSVDCLLNFLFQDGHHVDKHPNSQWLKANFFYLLIGLLEIRTLQII